MEQQQQEMGEIRSLVLSLGQHIRSQTPSTEQRVAPPISPPMPERMTCLIATSETYGGDPEGCEGFLVQYSLFFFRISHPLPDHTKVAFVVSRLMGKARICGAALMTNASPLMSDYAGFIQELKAVFYHLYQGRVCGQSLLRLRQGLRNTADYAVEFHTLVAGTHRNEPALVDAFVHGLKTDLQAELACKPEASCLNEVVRLAITYDRLLQEQHRQLHRSLTQRENDSLAVPGDNPTEPMQLGVAGIRGKLPNRGKGQQSVSDSLNLSMCKLPVMVKHQRHQLSASALADSGAVGNIMDWGFARRLWIKAISLPTPLSTWALEGGPVGVGFITHVTPCMLLEIRGGHVEQVSFYLLPCLSHPVTLGLPWLRAHKPHLHWSDNRVLEWAATCKGWCLSHQTLPLQSTSVESPEVGEGLRVPLEYSELEQVFSPAKTTQLPPDREWDCATIPPRCRVYPLSQEEDQIMAQYIKEALQQGYIRPSTSTAPASVFCVKKKDGGL
ncbi:hypothetical protein P4O66_002101 [Electrophorus voltai]|uniref:DUF4939 domain-containing protein n=1 Tax=Electrophorus voltai TaxID=2609070 RepID=A0AAD9DTE2_9TELE|nr:hypothetical protein P4O66_002101 [Electrophorus voltai]